jgi:hypothetical protein
LRQHLRDFPASVCPEIETNDRVTFPDGSQWLIQAANDDLGVSLSVGLGVVDEAWNVQREVFENGLEPTAAEAADAQMWLVSTAGRKSVGDPAGVSDLMPTYRDHGLRSLDSPGSLLFIEWSAPEEADINLPDTWCEATPHWTEERMELVAGHRAKATTLDAQEAFAMQWLNRWPRSGVDAARELVWFTEAQWLAAKSDDMLPEPGGIAAIEDRVGGPGGTAALAWVDGTTVCVMVEEFETQEAAYVWADTFEPSFWLVGYSLRGDPAAVERNAEPRSNADTPHALRDFRNMVQSSSLLWDGEPLGSTALRVLVKGRDTLGGLHILPNPEGVSSAALRCAAWAAVEATRRLIGVDMDKWQF